MLYIDMPVRHRFNEEQTVEEFLPCGLVKDQNVPLGRRVKKARERRRQYIMHSQSVAILRYLTDPREPHVALAEVQQSKQSSKPHPHNSASYAKRIFLITQSIDGALRIALICSSVH